MFKAGYTYLANYSFKKVFVRLYIVVICFLLLIWAKDKYLFSFWKVIAISTFLYWFGIGFSLWVLLIKLIDSKSYNPVKRKILITLYVLALSIIYLGPVALVLLKLEIL